MTGRLTIPDNVRAIVFDVMETLIPVSKKGMAGAVAKHSDIPLFAKMIGVIQTISVDDATGLKKILLRLYAACRLLAYLLVYCTSAPVVWRLYKTGKRYREFMRGSITADEFFLEVQRRLALRLNQQQFFELLLKNLPPPDPVLLGLLAEAKSSGIKVAVLTNVDPVMLKHFHDSYAWWRELDAVVASCNHGVLKPTLSLFASAEEKLGESGACVWFIDNSPENTDAASKHFRWRTLLWDK